MKLSVTFRARWDLIYSISFIVRSSEVAKLVPPCSTLLCNFLVRLLEVAIVIERQMIQGHQDPIRIIGIFPKGLGGPAGVGVLLCAPMHHLDVGYIQETRFMLKGIPPKKKYKSLETKNWHVAIQVLHRKLICNHPKKNTIYI